MVAIYEVSVGIGLHMAHNVIIKRFPKKHERQYEASGTYLQEMAFSDSSGTNKHSDSFCNPYARSGSVGLQCLWFSLRAVSPLQDKCPL